MKKSGKNKEANLRAIELLVEDHIADTGKIPSTTDVITKSLFSAQATRSLLDELVKIGRLTTVYEAPKNPTVFLPTYMYDALLRKQRSPNWINTYAFPEADKIYEEIHDREDQLTRYSLIQSLLYATGRRLEDAVAEAFKILEFENLETPYEDPDSWDISFTFNEQTYILDVKGKSKWADKGDVAQLQQWLEKYVDQNPKKDPVTITGGLVINHFKDLDPRERWPKDPERRPLSEAGERYLKLGARIFVTTVDIFQIVQTVIQKGLKVNDARKKLIAAFRKEARSD